jgi:hypothetical protein
MKSMGVLLAAALLPLVGGGLVVSCDDDPATPPATGGAGGGAAGGASGSGTGGGGPSAGGMSGGDAGPGAESGGCESVDVGADVTMTTTWDCKKYVLKKKIFVTNNAVLTIKPGTVIVGDATATDKAALIVTRGAKLIAKGNKGQPIVFTSSNAAGARVSGDWAGVALLGDATINGGMACTAAGSPASCREGNLEGLPVSEARGLFGGVTDTTSCGEIEYVRIEFAGAVFTEGKELNGLTLAGCGSGTSVKYVQIHRGKDDGIEFFGGTASVDHIVITGAEDDNLDWDFGWRGNAQFVVIHQYSHPEANHGFEASGNTMNEIAEPRSKPNVANVTLISEGSAASRAFHFKEGTQGKISHLIVQGFKEVANFTSKTAVLATEWPANLSVEHSFLWMNVGYAADAMDDDMAFMDQAAFEDAARSNKKDVDPMFTSLDKLTPNYVPKNAALMLPMGPSFGDTTATYAGALKPNDAAPWTDGWTAYPAN